MSDYKPQKGDRVRVVLEGEVGWVGSAYFEFIAGADCIAFRDSKNAVSIEKIEPPVEVFKPGDVVRSGNAFFALFDEGYVDLTTGSTYRDGRAFCEKAFTSAYYEKVNLG